VRHLTGLGINAICCSTLKRARRTAEIIGGALKLPVTDVAGLEEMDVGPYEGVADYSWVEPWRKDGAIAGVESFADMRGRIAPAINRALGTASHVLIVAHGGVFWALQHLCKAPFASLGHCHPARLSPEGETSWRVELLAEP
jgi:broad specificity phosphatase PhoE